MALPTDDAWLTMPPEPLEYQGRAEIAGFFQTRSSWRARPVRLGQGLIVLSCAGDQIAAITRFRGSLLPLFGLPASLPD